VKKTILLSMLFFLSGCYGVIHPNPCTEVNYPNPEYRQQCELQYEEGRMQYAEHMSHAFDGLKQPASTTNCVTNCSYGSCYTHCQ
jgi:hypothetical protein